MAAIKTEGLVDQEHQLAAVEAFRNAGARGLTRAELAASLAVSLRTSDRARAVLENQGAHFEPYFRRETREKAFVMAKGPSWDERLSREGRLALRVAAMALEHTGSTLWETQIEQLEKLLEKQLTNRDRQVFENIRKNVRVVGGVADAIEADQDVMQKILLAFAEGVPRRLELGYKGAGRSRIRTLTISPYCLTHDVFSGGTYLMGWEHTRRQPIQLRTSRIESAKVLAQPAAIPDPAQLERMALHQVGGWVDDQEPFEVRLRIEGASWVRSLEEAPPAFPGFELEAEGPEVAQVRFKATSPDGVMRWLLQLGNCVQILAPALLREKLLGIAQDLVRSHQHPARKGR